MVTTVTDEGSVLEFDHHDLMVFVLVLSIHGLVMLFFELLPGIAVGGVGIRFGPFLFVTYALVFLFRSFWACLAVPVGGIVFGELLVGEFGALGAIEGLLMIPISLFVAVSMVTDPENPLQIAALGLLAKTLEEVAAWCIDVGKFYVGVEDLGAVAGLPEVVWVVEGVNMLVQVVVAGVVFGAVPLYHLYPRLRGKLEPLLGFEPVPGNDRRMVTRRTLWGLAAYVALAPLAFVAAAAAETTTVALPRGLLAGTNVEAVLAGVVVAGWALGLAWLYGRRWWRGRRAAANTDESAEGSGS